MDLRTHGRGRPNCRGGVRREHHHPEDGTCPECGRTRPILARETCTVCKSAGWGSPAIKVLFHPAVVAFCYEREVPVGFTGSTDFDDVVRLLDLVETFEEELLSTDPLRVRVTVPLDGDQLHLTLDDAMNVVAVDESG